MSKSVLNVNNAGLTNDQAEKIWSGLRTAIIEIQNQNASELRFEELYRNSYTLVLHKYGDLLYNGVRRTVAENLVKISNEVSNTVDGQLLEKIVEAWENHKIVMTMINDVLMYMDKTYCLLKKKEPAYNMGVLLFKDHVIMEGQVANRLKSLLLENIRLERTGRTVDRILLKNVLCMLVEVNVRNTDIYKAVFESDLLSSTAVFYQQESQNFMAQNTVSDYLRKIERRIRQEEDRALEYLDKSTHAKLRHVVQTELISNYAQQLVENKSTGCVHMFHNDMVGDLRRMFVLFSRVPGTLTHIRSCMSSLVKKTGTNIVKDPENLKHPKFFVQKVLNCRKKFHIFVKRSFMEDRSFTRDLKDSLEYFINLDSRAARYLSLYLDDMMRKGLKGKSPDEREKILNDVISIFRYLSDKDVFEDFYKKHLASRLLTDNSGDREDEKMMISKLKAECGHQFTSRLEGMFADIQISSDLMASFKNQRKDQSNVDINVTVLTTGFWPVHNMEHCTLPPEAKKATDEFATFYKTRNSGRRLTWQTQSGTAEVLCHFKHGNKLLAVQTYQMCILMLYNRAETYTYAQIAKLTNIPDKELRRHLLSLAHPRVKVLKKFPNKKSLAPSHTFTYNYGKQSPLFRIKVPLLKVENDSKEIKVPPSVEEERKNRIEVMIVRVMKTRKTLDHNTLMSEVMKQSLRFSVKPIFIKKRIESLIEREYIERDKNKRGLYHYLA